MRLAIERKRRRESLPNFKVTEKDLLERRESIIELCNAHPGPVVEWDIERGCYGLKARQAYKKGKKVTEYGGLISTKPLNGDYVAKTADVYIDGHAGFLLTEKGRWINEYSGDPIQRREHANVKLGRDVRALRFIQEGEWLFADYGDEYDRAY